jgi:hypothetical protein
VATPVDDQTPGAAAARCADCAAQLAHDQRYCVACGARRGALPALAATLIGTAGPPAGLPAVAVGATVPAALELPNLRAIAVAVMALLGFGVIIGSAATPLRTVTPAAVAIMRGPVAALPAPAAAPIVPVVDVPATTPADNSVIETPSDSGSGSTSGADTPDKATPATASKFPPVKHVFLIVLSGQGFDQSFGDDVAAPYLAKTLTSKGELLAEYHAVAQGQLANEVALVSGQGPTLQTTANCPAYTDIAPGTTGDDAQVAGDGCVYPLKAQTIGDQLTADGESWKAYLQGFGASGAGAAATCRHPAPGAVDGEHDPRPGDPYVTWRNPFAYFHSIADGEGCGNEADLDDLAKDLKQAASTPALSYIVPDRCHDGADAPCGPESPGGVAVADEFLRTVVPAIEASAAYKDGGLIAITFDAAPQTGSHADASSCCDQPAYPNLPAAAAAAAVPRSAAPAPEPSIAPDPAATAPDPAAPAPDPEVATPISPPDAPDAAPDPAPAAAVPPPASPAAPPAADAGGGKVGLLLISSFVKAGTVNRVNAYNHFSLLRSIEDLFGLKHLGYAADPALPAFDKAVYNAPAPKP